MIDDQSGYFLISLDTELAWGHYDLDQVRRDLFTGDGSAVRESVDRLLKLFNEYGIVGTWAVVGHLFYDKCEDCEICPVRAWEGKYDSYEEIFQTADKLWYGADIIQKLLSSPISQEIGFHGYTHRIFNETELTAEDARVEAEEWLRVASKWGVGPGAIAFPRNQIGHLPIFEELGFVCFRGVETVPQKWQLLDDTRPLASLNPLLAYMSTPTVYDPRLDDTGLVDLPASRWIGSDHRLERRTGLDNLYGLRLAKVARAVEAAARENKIVHVYLHPYELRQESDFKRIRELLSVVGELVARGSIRSVGMADLARNMMPTLQKHKNQAQSTGNVG